MQLLLATSNPGKYREMRSFLNDLPITLLSLADLPKELNSLSPSETGRSFTANASLKSQFFAVRSGLITLADDSGLVIDALQGRPGIFSQRYGQTDSQRIERVLKELQGVPWSRRTARFVCALAIYQPQQDNVSTFRSSIRGYITFQALGTRNFGYDPIFYSPVLNKTFAQATIVQKNRISHRARAFRKLKPFLEHLIRTTAA